MPKLADLLNTVVDNPRAGKTRSVAPKVKALTLADITPDSLPAGTNERIVYMALYAASVIGHREGYVDSRTGETKHTNVVQHFVVSRELKDAGYLDELGERPYDVLIRLTSQGFVKQAGARGWIPTCFDTPYTRGARSQRGGRSSELRRVIDSMLTAPDEEEQADGTNG